MHANPSTTSKRLEAAKVCSLQLVGLTHSYKQTNKHCVTHCITAVTHCVTQFAYTLLGALVGLTRPYWALIGLFFVKFRQGSGNDRQGMAPKAKGFKA